MKRELLAWAIAAVATLFASASLFDVNRGPEPAIPGVDSSNECGEELSQARRSLITSESERDLLRAELDRMRGLLAMKKASDAQAAETGEDQLSEEEKRERAARALIRLKELAPQLMTGRREVYEGMRDVIIALIHAPIDDAAPFVAAYGDATDPAMQRILIPHILARDPDHAKEFLLGDLARSDDPEVRADLLDQLQYGDGFAADPAAQAAFLDALADGSNPRARQAAVAGLAKVDSPQAEQALLEVVRNDDDPAVREAAVRTLAARPGADQRIAEILGEEPDERLRTIGECTAKLAAFRGS